MFLEQLICMHMYIFYANWLLYRV